MAGWLARIAGSVAVMGVLVVPALAQSGAGAGALGGLVMDPSGAAVKGAEVIIRNEGTGYTRTVTTDASGHFAAGAMPIGTYAVEAAAPGFSAQRQERLSVIVGQTQNIVITLGVAAVSESVTVAADSSLQLVVLQRTGALCGAALTPHRAVWTCPPRRRAR